MFVLQDVQHGDIDYFYYERDFTYDTDAYAGIPEYVDHLKQEGTRFVTILVLRPVFKPHNDELIIFKQWSPTVFF